MIFAVAYTPKARLLVIGLAKKDIDTLNDGEVMSIPLAQMSPDQAPREIFMVSVEDPKDLNSWLKKADAIAALYLSEAGNG